MAALGQVDDGQGLQDGVLLRLHGVYLQGQSVAATWKAWSPASAPPHHLRWELRRIMPGVTFEETDKRPAGRYFRDEWSSWEALAAGLHLPVQEHLGRPSRAIAVRGGLDAVRDVDEAENS